MKSHLKVKVYSLTHEMTYIRRQEEKWKTKARIARQRQKDHATEKGASSLVYAENNFWSHRWHRIGLKEEARTTHLAYGFMKGRSYAQMEGICYGVLKEHGSSEPNWGKIEAMIERFSKDEIGPQDHMQRFAEWLEDAKKWYEGNEKRIPLIQQMREARRAQQANDPVYQAEKLARAMQARNAGLRGT